VALPSEDRVVVLALAQSHLEPWAQLVKVLREETHPAVQYWRTEPEVVVPEAQAQT
jgi:hypothetical protein